MKKVTLNMSHYQRVVRDTHRLMNNALTGTSSKRKQYLKSVDKFLRYLFSEQQAPYSIYSLDVKHIKHFICHLKRSGYQVSSFIYYLSAIRLLYKTIGVKLPSNKELGAIKPNKEINYPNDVLPSTKFQIRFSYQIYGMQVFFGLSYSEAVNLKKHIHIKSNEITVSSFVSAKSISRTIVAKSPEQHSLLNEVINDLKDGQSLKDIHGDRYLRFIYNHSLKLNNQPTNIQYRYHYARMRASQISSGKTKDIINQIKGEMGLSGITIWGYLNNDKKQREKLLVLNQ